MPDTKPSYLGSGQTFQKGDGGNSEQIKELQRDLRRLGYLRTCIDGDFGKGTAGAVRALQFDLLHNDGKDSQRGRNAPVAVKDFNTAALTAVDGVVTQPLAECMVKMLDADEFPKLPLSENPLQDNATIIPTVKAIQELAVPFPFLIAIFEQESDLQHYRVPSLKNDDNFILVGLDKNGKDEPDHITSRGYGVGQYTFFHHPLNQDEIDTYVRDVANNVRAAVNELFGKFKEFVVGPADVADDHAAEHPPQHTARALRTCKYAESDPRRMTDCQACMRDAGNCEIRAGQTLWFAGCQKKYEPTQYHTETQYRHVPIRAGISCDWPYAVRRYNGAGVNSFHYQTKILMRVLGGHPSGAFLAANTTR